MSANDTHLAILYFGRTRPRSEKACKYDVALEQQRWDLRQNPIEIKIMSVPASHSRPVQVSCHETIASHGLDRPKHRRNISIGKEEGQFVNQLGQQKGRGLR